MVLPPLYAVFFTMGSVRSIPYAQPGHLATMSADALPS